MSLLSLIALVLTLVVANELAEMVAPPNWAEFVLVTAGYGIAGALVATVTVLTSLALWEVYEDRRVRREQAAAAKRYQSEAAGRS